MTELRMSDVAEAMLPVAAALGFEADRAVLAAWHMALTASLEAEGINPVTAEEYRAAMLHQMHVATFRPKPAEVWEWVKARRIARREHEGGFDESQDQALLEARAADAQARDPRQIDGHAAGID